MTYNVFGGMLNLAQSILFLLLLLTAATTFQSSQQCNHPRISWTYIGRVLNIITKCYYYIKSLLYRG